MSIQSEQNEVKPVDNRLIGMGQEVRRAAHTLCRISSQVKNEVLYQMAGLLESTPDELLEANAQDLADARFAGLSPALLDRLTLNQSRLAGMAADLRQVALLPDPIGEKFEIGELPNGLKIHKQRVPLGVIGVIYEARPNVTIDVVGLGIKTGNALILRGGKETLNSNRALVGLVHQALREKGLPVQAIQFIDNPDRGLVLDLLHLQDYVDMLIPRGGAALHQFCRENSRIPVITGGMGICHLFVDQSADQLASLEVLFNAKVQRPSVCNALDTVLVHRSIAVEFLPQLVKHLGPAGVTFRADQSAAPFLRDPNSGNFLAGVHAAGPQDFDTEWLSLVLGIKVVEGIDEAIQHIFLHSTSHSDGILTNSHENVDRFVAEVDSAAVYVNASTRFTDGGQFGLGAEVAISTQRLHARGPMGLRELTTYKWVVEGNYHIRD